jgi:hypothetical protein
VRFARLHLMRLFLLTTTVFVATSVLLPTVAWAQAPSPSPMPPPTLSMATAVVMVLSLLLGIVTQMVQTGTVLGQWVTPKSWLPGATLVMTLLGGIVAYLTSQSPLVLNGATIFYAAAAGVFSLLSGAAPGLAVHAHVIVPEKVRQIRAARLAAKAAPPSPPSPPTAVATGAAGFTTVGLARTLAILGILGVCLVPGVMRPRAHVEQPPVQLVMGAGGGEGCGFWNSSGGGQVVSATTATGSCVLLQYLSGVTDPNAILSACDSGTLSQLVSILDSIITYYTTPQVTDAGTVASDAGPPTASASAPMVCGIGKPPVQGAPTCITQAALAGLKALRAAAAARAADAGAAAVSH